MRKQLLIYLIIGTIIILSFLLFSSVYYPLFNSDDGVNVLMLHYFKLPDDIYSWNQNRGGSIIPLIGQLFYKGLGLSSLWSESITHYIILILGYLSFSTLLKSNFSKTIFAIIWFFPILHFIGLVRYSFGIQYSLIGIGIYLINKYSGIQETTLEKKLLVLTTIFIVFVSSVWVTESAIVTFLIIILFLGYFLYKTRKNIKTLFIRLETLFTIVGSIIGVLIICFFKSIVTVDTNYNYNKQFFNSLEEFLESISIIKNILFDIFSFNILDKPISIYAYFVLILVVSLIFMKVRYRDISENSKKWFWVFATDGTFLLFIVLISHWAFLNGVARRYFTGVYITYWLAYLIYIDYATKSSRKNILQILITFTVIIGALSTIYSYKYVYPKRLTPKSEIVKEFEQLGEIGIISEYWNSYGTSFVNPDLIKATPHDKSDVKNYALVDSVFAQPKIYVIKDMWLESFPETLTQFGYNLIKKGKMFNIGDCWVCEYEKEKINMVYKLEHLKFLNDYMKYDNNANK